MTALNELFFVFSSPPMNPDRIFVSAFHTVTFQIWSMSLICRLKFVRTKFLGQNGVNRRVALTDSSPVVYVWITWEAWTKKMMGGGLLSSLSSFPSPLALPLTALNRRMRDDRGRVRCNGIGQRNWLTCIVWNHTKAILIHLQPPPPLSQHLSLSEK